VKHDWLGLAVLVCFGFAELLISERVREHDRAIVSIQAELHEETERADEAESRLSWRIREIERSCPERP
jgi:prefoldin subunit 5